jgi:P2 family phage major capsid protein
MLTGLAAAYSVETTAKCFNVDPTIAQTLNDESTESVDFLQRINVVPVDEIKGQKVMLGVSGPITGRADTDNDKERKTKDASALRGKGYELFPTESDVHMAYAKIDAWAKFPDFYKRYKAHVLKQISLDRIMVGWNGELAATETDLQTYPLLQDVNKGWIQLAREEAPGQVYPGEDDGAGGYEITLGPTNGDYKNLDVLVNSLKQILEPQHRQSPDLVVIIGDDLLDNAQAKYYENQAQTPSEKILLGMKKVMETYGGLQAYSVPYFPSKGVVITSFDNLSIYWQASSWRRATIDEHKKNRVEDYNSRNEGYVVEDYGKFAAIEADNVQIVD